MAVVVGELAMSTTDFKLMAMATVFVIAMVGSWLPTFIASNERVLSLLNMVSGGVFLAAGFVHLLNDAAENLEATSKELGFPLPFFLCACGFLLALHVEEFAHYVHSSRLTEEKDLCADELLDENALEQQEELADTIEAATAVLQPRSQVVIQVPRRQSLIRFMKSGSFSGALNAQSKSEDGPEYKNMLAVSEVHKCGDGFETDPPMKADKVSRSKSSRQGGEDECRGKDMASTAKSSGKFPTKLPMILGSPAADPNMMTALLDKVPGSYAAATSTTKTVSTPPSKAAAGSTGAHGAACSEGQGHGHRNSNSHSHSHGDYHGHDHGHGGGHGHGHLLMMGEGSGQASFTSAIILFLALSFHGLMEGIALGAMTDSGDKTLLTIFIAIIAHKGLEAFSLGTSLTRSQVSNVSYWVFLLSFSLMTTVGIAIGMILSAGLDDSLVSNVCVALASGTFIYVAIMEVIMKELAIKVDIAAKLALLLLGFGLMSVLALWV